MSRKSHPVTIPALDVLVGDPDILKPKEDTPKKAEYLYIPMQYIDKLGRFYAEHGQSTRKDSAQQLLGTIGHMLECINSNPERPFYTCQNGMKVQFKSTTSEVSSSSSKEHAIALAQELKLRNMAPSNQSSYSSISIMTGDNHMIAKTAAAKIDVTHVNPNIYTGFRKVRLPSSAISLWTRGRKRITAGEWEEIFGKSQQPLHANEFVILSYDYTGQTQNRFENIGRFDVETGQNGALVHLDYAKFDRPNYNRIAPKTPLQAMYLEALMAPPEKIPIVVIGSLFGTGKTFLPMAAGLYGVGYGVKNRTDFDPRYKRIFVCPRDGALGKDVGFLPGDLTSKTMPKALPILDNIEEILNIVWDGPDDPCPQELLEPPICEKKSRKKSGKKREPRQSNPVKSEVGKILERYFEFQPVINMGGRSISGSLMFYDESQDFELYQIRELATRFGNGTKMVFAGDPTQLSNPHLNYYSNGLSYIASKSADSPYAAVIFSRDEKEIVRHWALREIAKAFGM